MDNPDLPWPARWAVLYPKLVTQLAPEALGPLKTAFNAQGARSVEEFFDQRNREGAFTGPSCAANLEILVSVLDAYEVDAVLALRAALPSVKAADAALLAEPTPLLGFPPLRPEETFVRHELPRLIDQIARATPGTRIAMLGMGGVGKSNVVLAAISEPRVSSRFAFVYWISLTKKATKADRVAMLGSFYRNAWPTQPVPVADSVREFALQMQAAWRLYRPAKPPLVVLDDVWSREDAEMFENVPVTLVLTTRTKSLADAFRATVIPVEPLSDADQDRMLLMLSQVPKERDAKARPLVLARCGGLPLVINVVARMVRERDADAPWQDALGLFDSNRIGNAAPAEGDETVFSSLLTSSASLDERLAAEWAALCVFPTARWVPEGLVHLLWRTQQADLQRPDVRAQLKALFARGLVELKQAPGGGGGGGGSSVRLHAVMRDALTWKLDQGPQGRAPYAAQLQQVPAEDVLALIWREDCGERLDWRLITPPGDTYALVQDARYDGWRTISPARVEAMVRAADDESAAKLLTLSELSGPCVYPQEQWLAAFERVEPSVVVRLIEAASLIAIALDVGDRYARWPEVLAALPPAAVHGLVRRLSFVVLLKHLNAYGRWEEALALLEPTDLEALLVSDWRHALVLSRLKDKYKRWDIMAPAAVAKFLQSGDADALRMARSLQEAGYTRWDEVDKLTGPEIAQKRKETEHAMMCTIV